PIPGIHPSLGRIAGGTLLALVSLESRPQPLHGWSWVLPGALVAAGTLAAIVALGAWARPPREAATPAPVSVARVAGFGASWAILGWVPLLNPILGWHAYYGMFGMLGAWLAIAALLARWV